MATTVMNGNDCFKNGNNCFKWQRPFTKGKIASPIHQPINTQHVSEKNIIIVCFKATFLLCYKISSNRETAKQ